MVITAFGGRAARMGGNAGAEARPLCMYSVGSVLQPLLDGGMMTWAVGPGWYLVHVLGQTVS